MFLPGSAALLGMMALLGSFLRAGTIIVPAMEVMAPARWIIEAGGIMCAAGRVTVS